MAPFPGTSERKKNHNAMLSTINSHPERTPVPTDPSHNAHTPSYMHSTDLNVCENFRHWTSNVYQKLRDSEAREYRKKRPITTYRHHHPLLHDHVIRIAHMGNNRYPAGRIDGSDRYTHSRYYVGRPWIVVD